MDNLEVVGGHLEPSLDLLKFYKRKLEDFESERGIYLQRLADVEAQNSELHRLRWELRAREEEIQELQSTLGDAKLYLYDEREQLLKLQAENDSLKTQEVEDRRRIQHLLALTEPLTHEVTFFRDGTFVPRLQSPRSPATTPAASASSKSSVKAGAGLPKQADPSNIGRNGFSLAAAVASAKSPEQPQEPYPLVLEPLPSTLETTIRSLREQLSNERKLTEERVQALMKDRASLTEAADRKHAADSVLIAQLTKQLEETQRKLTDLTRDYLLQRHNFKKQEASLVEENNTVKALNMDLQAELTHLRGQATEELRLLKMTADNHSKALKSTMAASTDAFQDEVRILKAALAMEKATFQDKLNAKDQKYNALQQKYDELQTRRAREIEGFNTDITMMRKALKQLESQWVAAADAINGAAMHDQLQKLRDDIAAASTAEAARLILESNTPYFPEDATLGTGIESIHLQHRAQPQRARTPSRNSVSTGVVEVVTQVKDYAVPVITEPTRDVRTRSRLRVNGGLLHNHPVMYRPVASSGYGNTGRRGVVDPHEVNEAAVAPQPNRHQNALQELYHLVPAVGAAYADVYATAGEEVAHDDAYPVQTVVAAGEEYQQQHAADDVMGASPEHKSADEASETSSASSRARRLSGSARRVPTHSPDSGAASFGAGGDRTTGLRSQLDALKQRLRSVDATITALSHDS